MRKLIALAGRMQSGKDTLGDYLVTKHGYVKVGFADPLKIGLASILRIRLEELEELKLSGEILPQSGKTVRSMLQTLGTEWGRDLVHANFWNNLLEDRILNLHENGKNVVVTDVRFKNEVNLVQVLGGKVTYITRTLNSNDKLHSSENSIDSYECDYHITNSGTIEDMIDIFNKVIYQGG